MRICIYIFVYTITFNNSSVRKTRKYIIIMVSSLDAEQLIVNAASLRFVMPAISYKQQYLQSRFDLLLSATRNT